MATVPPILRWQQPQKLFPPPLSSNCSYPDTNFTTQRLNFKARTRFKPYCITNEFKPDSDTNKLPRPDADENDIGVKAALSMLRFYKREISPILPKSCRYIPTCSEYSMVAYKKYGVVKGTILTAWRICRCNPLGGSGFDPPRWFGEEHPSEQ